MDSSGGSKIAKDGFNNEKDIANSNLSIGKNDDEAESWLKTMGYDLKN